MVGAVIVAAAGIAVVENTVPVASSSYPGGQVLAPHSYPPGPCYWEEQNQHRVKDGVRYSCRPSGTAEKGLGWVDDEGRH